MQGLRALVRRTCHTPLFVAGQFVAITESLIAPGMRATIATEPELLLALEMTIRTLQQANAYLRSQL